MKQITEQSCIQALELAEYKLGHEPTVEEYNKLGLVPSATTIQRVCGSWNEAKEKAGMTANLKNRERGLPDHMTQQYSREDCIEAVREVDTRHEFQNLTQGVYNAHRDDEHPAANTVRERVAPFDVIREEIL